MLYKSIRYFIFLFAFAASSYAMPLAAPGSTQYVVIMNTLANPEALNITKTNVMIKYYDGSGSHPPCWVENQISYQDAPNVAGAGGKNACGKGVTPPAITKIDIVPLRADAGYVYESLNGVKINPDKFYTNIIIEQSTPPTFNPDGSVKVLGKMKARILNE